MKRLLFLLPIALFAHDPQGPKSFTRPPEKEITVEAQPWVKNCVAEPIIEADFIYWKVKEDALNYARTGVGTFNAPVPSSGKIYGLEGGGELGFKVALGLNLAHDGWDVLLRYTWLNANDSDSQTAIAETRELDPIWFHNIPGFIWEGVSKATAKWDLHTNKIDLEWGRHFYISRFLTLRPFFGLKGYWDDQDFDIVYEGLTEGQGRGVQRVKMGQDVWGMGLRFGMNTAWYFARNWSVFADMALSGNWSRFDIKRKETGTLLSTGASVVLLDLSYDRYAIIPVLELASGLRWEMWFHDDSYHFAHSGGMGRAALVELQPPLRPFRWDRCSRQPELSRVNP